MRKHFLIWIIISVIITLAYLIVSNHSFTDSIAYQLGTIIVPLAITLFIPLLLSFIIMKILRYFMKTSPSKIFLETMWIIHFIGVLAAILSIIGLQI